jgi:hypothetical protein
MGRLHELLAVEPEIKSSAESILSETISVFEKKHDHFVGLSRVYTKTKEDSDDLPAEHKLMVTTVKEKFEHTEKALAKWLDLMCSKETTNTCAKADLVIEGLTMAKSVPAVVLLNLENKLKHIKQMYLKAPTLEPGQDWSPDTERAHTFRTQPAKSYRTNKVLKPVVLYPATDKHPAQVEKLTVDENVGMWSSTKYSGMIAPVLKADILARVDTLIEAVKRARCRANEQEVSDLKLGSSLFQFIETGVVAPVE